MTRPPAFRQPQNPGTTPSLPLTHEPDNGLLTVVSFPLTFRFLVSPTHAADGLRHLFYSSSFMSLLWDSPDTYWIVSSAKFPLY
jgi:hypothetical protein